MAPGFRRKKLSFDSEIFNLFSANQWSLKNRIMGSQFCWKFSKEYEKIGPEAR